MFDQRTFAERFGAEVEKFGYTQIPNIAIWNSRTLGLKPVDLCILIYFSSYSPDSFHAVSSVSKSLGIHPKTVRTALRRMESRKLLRRIFRRGEASKYDTSGWIAEIKLYPKLYKGLGNKSYIDPTKDYDKEFGKELDTNKDKYEELKPGEGYQKYLDARKKWGYNDNASQNQ